MTEMLFETLKYSHLTKYNENGKYVEQHTDLELKSNEKTFSFR